MNTCSDFGHLIRTEKFEEIRADSWTFQEILYFLRKFVDNPDGHGHFFLMLDFIKDYGP